MSGSTAKLIKELKTEIKALLEKKKNPKLAKVNKDVLQDKIKEKRKVLQTLKGPKAKKPIRRFQRSKITDYFKPPKMAEVIILSEEEEVEEEQAPAQQLPSSAGRPQTKSREPLKPITNQIRQPEPYWPSFVADSDPSDIETSDTDSDDFPTPSDIEISDNESDDFPNPSDIEISDNESDDFPTPSDIEISDTESEDEDMD